MNLADRLVENKRAVEILERRAAAKVGMRFQLLDETQLFGKDREVYVKEYVEHLLVDIGPEIREAVKLGRERHGALEE